MTLCQRDVYTKPSNLEHFCTKGCSLSDVRGAVRGFHLLQVSEMLRATTKQELKRT